jgi:hypothetical protein
MSGVNGSNFWNQGGYKLGIFGVGEGMEIGHGWEQ